jgi:hypothetical protein
MVTQLNLKQLKGQRRITSNRLTFTAQYHGLADNEVASVKEPTLTG